ncbi:hypothetical protein Moror_8891 [Moniliophthora roreri MCA 2997]|uniref:NYN domain-containing protein n=2 Tax=Moniliophthora roreri TaxID=221103 RepID=V2X1H4_MONRO|nr:hypothetical protein Moror_8891 [Moniliophthora roreri MCA 2997]KAI3610535.1 hypothetical protein WG66_007182 [Moniliophthora roreri]
MSDAGQAVVFWDYENCPVPFNASGFSIVNQIRGVVQQFGGIKLFRAYADLSELSSPRSLCLRSELQCSGVSLIDCPHNGRKNVADQMIIVDMLAYAIDHSTHDTIVLISGDRDFAYALSTLRFRLYKVVVMAPSIPTVHISLRAQASIFIDWNTSVLNALKDERSQFEPQLSCNRENEASSTRHPAQPSPQSPENNVEPGVESGPREYSRRSPTEFLDPVDNDSPEGTCEKIIAPTARASIPALPVYTPPVESSPFALANDPVVVKSPYVRPHSAPPDAPVAEYLIPEPVLSPAPVPLAQEVVPPSDASSSSVSTQISVPPVESYHTVQSLMQGPSRDADIQPAIAPSLIELHVPAGFQMLVQILQRYYQKGVKRPFRSLVAVELANCDKMVYRNAGVPRFREYTALAVSANLIEMGGKEGGAWMAIHPDLLAKL